MLLIKVITINIITALSLGLLLYWIIILKHNALALIILGIALIQVVSFWWLHLLCCVYNYRFNEVKNWLRLILIVPAIVESIYLFCGDMSTVEPVIVSSIEVIIGVIGVTLLGTVNFENCNSTMITPIEPPIPSVTEISITT